MQLLKRWHESEFFLAGQPLRLKLKALSFAEAPAFLRTMSDYAKKRNADPSTDLFEALSADFVRESFEAYVKPADADLTDEDGGRIESGRDVFKIANPGLAVAVLARLEDLSILTAVTGKDSSSPSTSEPAGTPSASDSPATSTEPADGPSA